MTQTDKHTPLDRELLAVEQELLSIDAMEDAAYWKREARTAQSLNKELLATLKAVAPLAYYHPHDQHILDDVRRAIAKAEGKQP